MKHKRYPQKYTVENWFGDPSSVPYELVDKIHNASRRGADITRFLAHAVQYTKIGPRKRNGHRGGIYPRK